MDEPVTEPIENSPPTLTEPCPCDDCEMTDVCRRRRLACAAFRDYTRGAARGFWSKIRRKPTRDQWDRLFDPSIDNRAGISEIQREKHRLAMVKLRERNRREREASTVG
jgi:hypothetical protein